VRKFCYHLLFCEIITFYKFRKQYTLKIKEQITNLYNKFTTFLAKDMGGYDVFDFREGTIIGTIVLILLPVMNWVFMNIIPDHAIARSILIVIQILALAASYKYDFVKKWANEIGNTFSLAYAFLTTTVAYLNNFKIEETAFNMMIIFGLFGMFKDKKMLLYFMLLTCSYMLALIFASDINAQSKQFLTIIAIPFFSIGYYVFSIKLDNIERITKREHELSQREAWFRNIFNNAAVGIVLLDNAYQAFKFNKYFQEITGFTEGELVDIGIKQLIHPEDVIDDKEFVKIVSQSNPPNEEQRIMVKTGDYVWMRCSFSTMKLEEQTYTICMFIDITTQKLADQKLRENARDLISHNEALEEFSYVISHDLQEPLRMITSFSQIIKKRYLSRIDDEQAMGDFDYVIDGAKRMSTLIRDMLEYSRWSAKALPVEKVDTRAVLAETLQNLTVSLTNSNAEVISEDMPIIHANRLMISQVFQNLIGNAIRYAQPECNPVIEIKVVKRPFDTLFSVKDNGIGFEPQYAERIFGIFQRLHPEKSSGNGMGLAICKRIIEKQGGRIWAESELNVGSTFYFSLPSIEPIMTIPIPTIQKPEEVEVNEN
jgi:PAS domain S-box-containing protein